MEKGRRNLLSRIFHAKTDKETITAWKSDLNGILHVFNVRSVRSLSLSLTTPLLQTELAINTHTMVLDLHRNALGGQEGADGQISLVSATLFINGGILTTRP